MFGVLNVPEIERETQYIDTTCSIVDELTTVTPFIVCTQTSRSCIESYADSCSANLAQYNAHDKYNLDPNLISAFEGKCSAGYMCCRTHCETCTRCSTSCSRRRSLGRATGDGNGNGDKEDDLNPEIHNSTIEGQLRFPTTTGTNRRKLFTERRRLYGSSSGGSSSRSSSSSKSKSCSRSCSTYACNCRCISSVSNAASSIECHREYESRIAMAFPPTKDSPKIVTVSLLKEFGKSESDAQSHITSFRDRFKNFAQTREQNVTHTVNQYSLTNASATAADNVLGIKYVVTSKAGVKHKLRKSPSLEAEVVGLVQRDEIIRVVEVIGDWVRISNDTWSLAKSGGVVFLEPVQDRQIPLNVTALDGALTDLTSTSVHCKYDPDLLATLPTLDTVLAGQNSPVKLLPLSTGTYQLAMTWEMGYTAGYWVAFGIPCSSVVAVAALLVCIVRRLQDEEEAEFCYRWNTHTYRRTENRGPVRGVHVAAAFVTWVGVIFPLCLLLPIEQHAPTLEEDDRASMRAVIYILLAIGWTPVIFALSLLLQKFADAMFDKCLCCCCCCCGDSKNVALSAAATRRMKLLQLAKTVATITVTLGWIVPVILSGTELFAPLHILNPIPLVMIFGSLVGIPLLGNIVLFCLCDVPIFVCATRNAARARAAEKVYLAKKKEKLEREAEDKRKALFRKQAVEQLRRALSLEAAHAKAQKLNEKARAAEELARKAQLAAEDLALRVHDDEESQDTVAEATITNPMRRSPKSLQSLRQPSRLQGLRVATTNKIKDAGVSVRKINRAVNSSTGAIIRDIRTTLRVSTQSSKQKALASIKAAQLAGCDATKFQCFEVVEWMDSMPSDLDVLESGANTISQICQDEQASDQRRMTLKSRFAETGAVETLLRAVSYIYTNGSRQVEFAVKRLPPSTLGGQSNATQRKRYALKHTSKKDRAQKQEQLKAAMIAACDALRHLVHENQQNAKQSLQFVHNGAAGDAIMLQAQECWSVKLEDSPVLEDFFNSTEVVKACELVVGLMKKNAAESRLHVPSGESKDNDELTGQAKESDITI